MCYFVIRNRIFAPKHNVSFPPVSSRLKNKLLIFFFPRIIRPIKLKLFYYYPFSKSHNKRK